MKMNLPKSESVKMFLLLKDWELVETNKGYFIMKPPANLGFPDDFKLWLARWEHAPHYSLIIFDIVRDIAHTYQWEEDDLAKLLAKTPAELVDFLQIAIRQEQSTKQKTTAQKSKPERQKSKTTSSKKELAMAA